MRLSDVEEKVDSEEVLAMKADIAQMKAEHAQGRATDKQNSRKRSTNWTPRSKLTLREPMRDALKRCA